MGVEVLDCDAPARPPEGVEAAGLAAVEDGVLGVAGLDPAVELLAVPAVGGRAEPEAGRGGAGPDAGLEKNEEEG